MKKIYAFILTITFGFCSYSQNVISALNTPYSENFDGMGAAGTTYPNNWTGIRAAGTGTANALLTLVVTNGTTTSGGTFNVGTTTEVDRALGTLASGSTIPAIGTSFTNSTGALISKISLAGVMEQWKSGSDSSITENLIFSYSLDATSLNGGTWIAVPGFNLVEKLTATTTAGNVVGNDAANKTSISSDISLAWSTGSTLWIKWTDANDAGSDGIYAIDDFSLTAIESSTAPMLTINTPLDATTFPPLTDVNSTISVSNFTVANGTGSGHINYILDGGQPISKYDANALVLSGLTAGTHTLVYTLVDNSNAPLIPDVSASVTFIIANISTVANIAALRAGTSLNYYTLTGTAVVSHVRTPAGSVTVSSTRNQKFIQDATGGILIDDAAGKITTDFAIGNTMNNVSGQLKDFGGVWEFIPLQSQSVASTISAPTPQVITLSDLNANPDAYECELIKLNGITITGFYPNATPTVLTTPIPAGAVFSSNTSYQVTVGGVTSILRTGFAEADYIIGGAAIPTGSFDVVALGYHNVTTTTNTPQFIIRNAADFSVTLVLATTQNEIAGLKVYPNPVSNGVLHIESNLNTERTVTLFDVLGKQVLSTSTSNNTINVAALNSGVYIVKINEGGNTATRKVVIR